MSEGIKVALIALGGTVFGIFISVATKLIDVCVERKKRKEEKTEKEYEVKREKLNEVYGKLIRILNAFPNGSPNYFLKDVDVYYQMESFESVINMLNQQIELYEKKLSAGMVNYEEKSEIETEISNRKFLIKEVEQNKEEYLSAKSQYAEFKENDNPFIAMYGSQEVKNSIVEFEVALHNVFVSGMTFDDIEDKYNTVLARLKNKIIDAIRKDIGAF